MPESRSASIALVVLCAVILPGLAGLIVGGIAAPERNKLPEGYLVGGPSVTFMAPPNWRQVRHPPSIPGLRMTKGVALAPNGNGARAGLVAGQVSTAGQGPLPSSLLRRVQSDLRTEVVGVGTWDGYRYDNLRISGFAPRLVLYAVPTSEGSTAVACYASPGAMSFLRPCEDIARSLEILSSAESDLPEVSGTYARSVSRALGKLDRSRVAQRRALKSAVTPARAAAMSRRLSMAYANAARSLAAAAPPDAADGANALLVKRLWSSRDAYRQLSSAAAAEDQGAWNQARRGVVQAEQQVGVSLGDLGALGYGRTA